MEHKLRHQRVIERYIILNLIPEPVVEADLLQREVAADELYFFGQWDQRPPLVEHVAEQ